MATNYVSPKQTDIYFVITNTSRQGKTIRIFGKTIQYGKTYDLLSLPNVSEADIRESLVKGVLANRIRIGDIRISSSNIDLTQYSESQKQFLMSAGLTVGLNTVASGADYTPVIPDNWPMPAPTTVAEALDDVVSLPSIAPVTNLAALAAVTATSMPTGTTLRVNTLRSFFTLDKASVLASDGITVIAAVGGGRWIRQAPISPDRVWLNQASWFIDPAAGNDEATGLTEPTAIKTWAEYIRRVGSPVVVTTNVTVTWLGPNSNDDLMHLEAQVIANSAILHIRGVRGTAFSGVTTAYAPHPVGTNTECKLTAGGGFTPTPNTLIEFTSGPANGAFCWVAKDLTGGVARVSTPCTVPVSAGSDPLVLANPTVGGGDSFRVCSLTEVRTASIEVRGISGYPTGGQVVISDMNLVSVGNYVLITAEAVNVLGINNCTTDYATFSLPFMGNSNVSQYGICLLGECNFEGGLYSLLSVSNSAVFTSFIITVMFQGSGIQLFGGAQMVADVPWCSYDTAGFFGGLTMNAQSGASFGSEVYGSGNIYGVVQNGVGAVLRYATLPKITGSGGDANIGGQIITWATQTPYYNPRTGCFVGASYPNASVMNTTLYANPDIGRSHKLSVTRDAANHFILPDGSEQANAGTTVPNLAYVVESNGVLRNLRVHLSTPPTTGKQCVVTLYRVAAGGVASAATTLTVTLGAADVDKADVTHTMFVNPGDLIVANQNSTIGAADYGISVAWEVS